MKHIFHFLTGGWLAGFFSIMDCFMRLTLLNSLRDATCRVQYCPLVYRSVKDCFFDNREDLESLSGTLRVSLEEKKCPMPHAATLVQY